MKILIICPTTFYNKITGIKEKLEEKFEVETPNCFDNPVTNEDNKNMTEQEYLTFFKQMYNESKEKIESVDAVLVLNFDKTKNGLEYKNYIGASTFLEMYEAYMQGKKIYMYNGLPCEKNILLDEIKGFGPILIDGDLSKIEGNSTKKISVIH